MAGLIEGKERKSHRASVKNKIPCCSVKDNGGTVALAASEKHLGQGCDHCLGSLKIQQKNIAANLTGERATAECVC